MSVAVSWRERASTCLALAFASVTVSCGPHAGELDAGTGASPSHEGEEATSASTEITLSNKGAPGRRASAAIQYLMDSRGVPVPIVGAGGLAESDRTELVRLYRSEPSPRNRKSYANALTFLGGHGVTELFTWSLTQEFNGRILSRKDEQALHGVLYLLGLLATEDPEAVHFLVRASEPAFWEVQFRAPAGDDVNDFLHGTARRFAATAIQSLGLSGRPVALERLTTLKRGLRKESAIEGLESVVAEALQVWETTARDGGKSLKARLYHRGTHY